MSQFDEEYDSDTEYVPDYDMIDLNDFRLNKGTELVGGSWGAVIEHLRDDDISFQFALPPFQVGEKLDISEASKNGFFRLNLNLENDKHIEFRKWIVNVDNWLVEQFTTNHNNWFGHMWSKGGPLEGRPVPPKSAIKEMYHPIIDDENIFCSRVHIRKGQFEIQCMDSNQNMIDLSQIKNCKVVLILDKPVTLTFFLLLIKENSLIPDIRNSLKIIKIEGSNIILSIELKNSRAEEVKILSDIGSNTFP